MYPIELEIEDTINTARYASSFDLLLEIDSGRRLRTNIYGSTVGTNRNAYCVLKNRPTKHNKYISNKKLEHFNNISFRELFGRITSAFYFAR
jgi:hypothetical protein